jgi:hypothetical protein
MWIVNLIVALVCGAAGGNIAGSLLKDYNLGTVGNSIAGIIGGGLGGQILGLILGSAGAAATGGGLDIASIIEQVVGGGLGGGVLMIIVGLIKQIMGGERHA